MTTEDLYKLVENSPRILLAKDYYAINYEECKVTLQGNYCSNKVAKYPDALKDNLSFQNDANCFVEGEVSSADYGYKIRVVLT